MSEKKVFSYNWGGRLLQVEIGQLAKQANGAVLVRYGDTVVLTAAVGTKQAKDTDFFPLTVNYEEKMYAAGKIPGGFIKREGRPSEHATLTARLIDRPIRPMFAEGFRNEVQITNTVMSVDPDCPPEKAAMFGSSLALCISDIPFDGPIAGVDVGRVNGEYVINPTTEQKENSDIELSVAGTATAINMVESSAKEVNEEDMLGALLFGHEEIKKLVAFQEEIVREVGKEKMNALYVIHKYLDIKSGNIPARSITIIFGGKAAPAYVIAQDVIHLILSLSELIANDPEVSPYLQVVMVENYNVTAATHLIPACNISEQISLASKEASGTGNMKFMLNGALTLGTEDGANVEIHELVGDDNIYIFGEKSDEVIAHYEKGDYNASEFAKRDAIRPLVEFVKSDALLEVGNQERLERLYQELTTKDWFMTLLDLEDYIETKERMYRDFENRDEWNAKVVTNIAMAGFFSSDRTIEDYNRDIWTLK